MFRLVQKGEKAPQNFQLREALDRVKRGSSTQVGLPILEEHEAEALYSVLASRHFPQVQLDDWIDRLRADHPYDRTRRGKSPSLWAIIRWIVFGGEKPWKDDVESDIDWVKRTERWIQEQMACVDETSWLERPLQALIAARYQITHETGKSEWHMPILRWALVSLITLPQDVATSDTRATGSDAR